MVLGHLYGKKQKFNPYLIPYHPNKSRDDIQVLEGNIGKFLYDLGVRKQFLQCKFRCNKWLINLTSQN